MEGGSCVQLGVLRVESSCVVSIKSPLLRLPEPVVEIRTTPFNLCTTPRAVRRRVGFVHQDFNYDLD